MNLTSIKHTLYANLRQKVRFAAVGGLNTAVSYFAFVTLYQQLDNYILASVLAYCIGVMCSFLLNRGFVFNSQHQKGQFIPFILVNLASLGASTLTLYLLVTELHINAYIGQFFSIFVSMIMNYIGYQRIFKNGISLKTLTQRFTDGAQTMKLSSGIRAILFLACLAVTLHNVYTSVLINIAHDALPYMAHYSDKFTSEGRWINFAVFPISSSLNPQLANALCFLFIGMFGYNVSRSLSRDRWLAAFFALTVMNIPYYTMLFKWPMTLLPGCIMLALFSYYRNRLSIPSMLLIAGVLLFATYPAFYFVMPLIYIAHLKDRSYKDIMVFMLWWAAGYVLGYLIGNGLIYLYTWLFEGHAHFMQMASWRKESPLTGMASLIHNVDRSTGDFVRNANYISELSAWYFLPALGITLLMVKDNVKYFLILLAMIISIYASVVVLGVHVPLRSGITLPLGIAMVVFLLKHPWAKYINLILLLIPLAYQTYHYNNKYNNTRIIMSQVIEKNDVNHKIEDKSKYDKIVATVDQEKMSEWLKHVTGSKQFNNLSNLEYHMIRPYFYKQGWPDSAISVKYIHQKAPIKGETEVSIKDRTLYVRFE